MSTNIMRASHQWATRPDDERFTSLHDMQDHFDTVRSESREVVVSSRRIECVPHQDNHGLEIVGPNGNAYSPTHYSFGQLAALAEAPSRYLRTLPSPMAADCINYGLKVKRDIEDVGILLQKNHANILRAATGPRYGRIWNSDVVSALVRKFGDGVTGTWRVPGEFGQDVVVDKQNTTLYASDRDMFIFLADEKNRIEIPNRRNGESGTLARGFFAWNSEVGDKTFGVATFLFDFVCCNRIIWGAESFQEIRIRHTASAPDKYLEEIRPALQTYADASTAGITKAIEDARSKRLDNVDDFLAKRFSKGMSKSLQQTHMLEEGRPIETIWDATTAVTAVARGIPHQDQRVELERKGGDLMKLAA